MNRLLNQRQRAARLAALIVALQSCVAVPMIVHAAEHTVEIHSFKFIPDRLTVKAGDKVTWINRDIAPHTATAADRTWDTKGLGRGESNTLIITGTTTLSYFCRFHPHMKATLVVKQD